MRKKQTVYGRRLSRLSVVILSVIGVIMFSTPAECQAPRAGSGRKPFILFLDSYHTDYPWSVNVRSGVREQLQADAPGVGLVIEYMDTKHYPPEQLFPILADLFDRKYRRPHQPSVIIASDNNALSFITIHRQRLFADVPVVFCGINNFKDAMLNGQKNITGVVEAASFGQTIALALKLHPETTAIYSVAGSATTTQIHVRELADVADEFADRVQFIGQHGYSLAEFAVALKNIPKTGIVLYLGLYRDARGTILSLEEGFTFIRTRTDRPIYTMWSQNLPYCLGGVMISGQEQGRQAAAMAAKILAGEPADSIPIVRESPNVPMFNYLELQRFHIDTNALPPNAVVINQPPPPFYTQYRYHVWTAVGLIALLSGLVAALATLNVSRRNAMTALGKARNDIANIINSMPSVLISVDATCNVTQWNKEAAKITGVDAAEAMGQPLLTVFPRLTEEIRRVQEAMRTRKTCTDLRRARQENGGTRYEDLTIFPLLANGAQGAVIRLDDVTERVRIEELMVQSEKMLSVGGLAAGMAHEINNPLAGIMQTADVMNDRLTDPTLPANQQAAETAGTTMEAIRRFMNDRGIPRMLENIRSSGSRAAEIVNNMLSFARKSNGTAHAWDLATLVDQTIDLTGTDYDLKKNHDFRQIRVVREYAADLPRVPCEAGKIQQVLLNILRNGAEAMQLKWGEVLANANGQGPQFTIRLINAP